MTEGIDIREPSGEGEVRQAWQMLSRAFNWPAADEDKFVEGVGPLERCQVAVIDGEVAAFARVRPFGQYYGGRSVPMAGFSPVGVDPQYRGHGLASLVTAAHYPILRERGEVVSGLYPASTRLYRGVGFEVAGVWAERVIPIRSLQMLPRAAGVAVRRASTDDIPAIQACYGRVAPNQPGWLDRPEVWWKRILKEGWADLHVYVVDGGNGEIAGYVVYRQAPDPKRTWGYEIQVSNLISAEPDATLALWRLVASSATMVNNVRIVGPVEHPLLLLLPEQDLEASAELRYMLRILDAAGAVAARGYPPVDVVVDLELTDRHCDWNVGRWQLEVVGGRGELLKGGSGAVRLGIGAFASLFSGYSSPRTLAAAGLLYGAGDDELTDLTTLFSGPTPWMPDFF
jgi:predicted acetyltransferase